MQWANKLREHKRNPIYTTKSLCRCWCIEHVFSSCITHSSLQMALYGSVASAEAKPTREPITGGKKGRRRVPPDANAEDKEHCGKEWDCAPPQRGGWERSWGSSRRVVFGNIYTWNISPVMEENQRIGAHQHRRRIIMHYGHSFTLTQILPFVKISCGSRWEMKRNLLAGRLLKSPLGCTCSRWVEIKVEDGKFLKLGPPDVNSLSSTVPARASPSSPSQTVAQGLKFISEKLGTFEEAKIFKGTLWSWFQIESIHFGLL